MSDVAPMAETQSKCSCGIYCQDIGGRRCRYETQGESAVTPTNNNQACQNTDREIWRERKDDYYSDSIHVTERGGIGINCHGYVIVKPLVEWHRQHIQIDGLKKALQALCDAVSDGTPRDIIKTSRVAECLLLEPDEVPVCPEPCCTIDKPLPMLRAEKPFVPQGNEFSNFFRKLESDEKEAEIERLRSALKLIADKAGNYPRSSWTANRALEGKDFENYGVVTP